MKSYLLRSSLLWVRGLILALLSVSLVALFTQSAYAVTFAKTYGGTSSDGASSVQRTSDGGYIVAGQTYSFGEGSWDILLIKTNANGDIIWAKTYGGTNEDRASSVQRTSDGGYIVAGATWSFGEGSSDIFLIKTDENGNVQWAKTYGGTHYDIASSVQQTSDGGYIVAGYTYSFGAGVWDIFLIKTDADGNLEWAKTYGGTGNDRAFSVQQTSGGGYIVVAGYADGDILLIKTDADGNVEWAKTYGGTGYDEAYSVQQTSDGGYIVAGYTGSWPNYDLFLIKTDANGNVEWAKTYDVTEYDWAYSVQQTSDGGYIVAVYADGDILLIKTDADGNVEWAKTYGETSWDEAYSVQQTSDGGYIVAGYTGSFGAGGYDIFLIKTDENGDIGSCSIVSSVIPTLGIISPTVDVASPSVSSPSLSVNPIPLTDASPSLMILIPCPLSISESCQIASGTITPYKGGIKVRRSGEFEVKVYNVSGGMVKSARGKNEVKLELSRGVYFVEVILGGKVIREKVVVR